MRAGIDSYSYHRFFGHLRGGEEPPSVTWTDGVANVVREMRRLGLHVLSLETCFVGAPPISRPSAWPRPRASS